MSEGGFDYEAHRRSLQGNPDKALLVSFEYASEKRRDGTFDNVEMIRIWMDKNTEVVRRVTESDKLRFTERYQAFKKGEEAPATGTPIRLVPFATRGSSPSQMRTGKVSRVPPPAMELIAPAANAAQNMASQGSTQSC
jgi:hypothetical protein